MNNNCPFYAASLFFRRGVMPAIISNPTSNQCAIITDAHSPCRMQVFEGQEPDWKRCMRNPANNGSAPSRVEPQVS